MLVSVCLATACSSSERNQRTTACARASAAALRQVPGVTLRGDVTGDSRADRVALVQVRTAPKRCSFFLVVKSKPPLLPLALREHDEGDSFVDPALSGLGPIDARPGMEIVAKLHAGASTSFAAVFTVVDGHVRLIALGRPTYSEFGYGGSVTHVDAVDCSGTPGEVDQLTAASDDPAGQRWVVERHMYRVVRSRFEPLRTTTRHVRSPDAALGALGPGPQPFPSCLSVRPR